MDVLKINDDDDDDDEGTSYNVVVPIVTFARLDPVPDESRKQDLLFWRNGMWSSSMIPFCCELPKYLLVLLDLKLVSGFRNPSFANRISTISNGEKNLTNLPINLYHNIIHLKQSQKCKCHHHHHHVYVLIRRGPLVSKQCLNCFEIDATLNKPLYPTVLVRH